MFLVSGAMLAWLFRSGAAGVAGSADQANRAALVVVHGDGSVLTRCVDFGESQLTGLELLQRSGLDLNVEASSMGATICRLDAEGCTFPQESCFCQCEGPECRYWSYWRWDAGVWRYSQLGAANSAVLPGAIDGWVWGVGAGDGAAPLPAIEFETICAPPAATATPTPTASPTATSTATDLPAATVAPTATPAPLPAATATPAPPPATPPPTATPAPTATPVPPTATAVPTATPPPIAVTPPIAPGPAVGGPPPATLAPTAAPAAPVVEFFTSSHSAIPAGASVTLGWRTGNAAAVQLQVDERALSIAAAGALLLAPQRTTTYRLVAANATGVTAATLTVAVGPPEPAPASLQQASGQLEAPPAAALPASPIAPDGAAPAPPAAVIVLRPQQAATLAPVALAVALVSPVAAAPPATPAAPAPFSGTLWPWLLVGLPVLACAPLLAGAGLLLVWTVQRRRR